MELNFRFARTGDVDLYFSWVNEKAVRQNSFNQEPISYADHVKWFNKRLHSDSSFLYLFFNAQQLPVGQVRIERAEETIIDVSVDKAFRGKSYADKIIHLACVDFIQRFPQEVLNAHIKRHNEASYKAFLKAGFEESAGSPLEFFSLQFAARNMSHNPLTTIQKEEKQYDIERHDYANDDLLKKYLELFYACFGFRQHLDEAWFKWFYLSNPLGICNNYLLHDKTNSRYAGAYALSRSYLVHHHTTSPVGIGVNGMVHPDYRNQGLYGDLISVAVANDSSLAQATYLHGTNRGTIKGHLNAGWKVLKKIHFYALPVVVAGNTPGNVHDIVSFAAHDHADLFVPKGYSSYMEKSAAWLDWRFTNRPHKQYISFVCKNAGEQPSGYMVLSIYRSASLSRCQIVDYNAADEKSLMELLQYAMVKAAEANCQVLDLWIDDYSRERDFFISQGFERTEEFYELLVFDKEGIIFDKHIKTVLADLDAV